MANNIEVRKVFMQDIEHIYPDIYKSIFDDIDPYQCPSIVYLGFENGLFEGFVSGYIFNAITFYMQYAGILKNFRGVKTLNLFREGLKAINAEFPFIMCVIRNDNSPALRLALKEGFIVHGIRQDTGRNLYVELIRGINYGKVY